MDWQGLTQAYFTFSLIYLVGSIAEILAHKNEPMKLKERFLNLTWMIFYITAGNYIISNLPVITYKIWRDSALTNPYLYALCYLIFIDTCFYLYHRAQHHFKWLWKVHHFHHSASEMNVTISFRTNLFDFVIQHFTISFPALLLFGYNKEGYLLTYYISLGMLFFSHLKLNIGGRILSKIIITPNLHGVHHESKIEGKSKNFAQMFPFLDILGRTYHPHK